MGAHRRSSFRLPVAVVAALLVGLLVVPGSAAAGTSRPSATEAGTVPPTFDLTWGSYGTGAGQFANPAGVAVAPNGDVVVADRGTIASRGSPAPGHPW